MPDPKRKITRGEKFRMPATAWNQMLDAVRHDRAGAFDAEGKQLVAGMKIEAMLLDAIQFSGSCTAYSYRQVLSTLVDGCVVYIEQTDGLNGTAGLMPAFERNAVEATTNTVVELTLAATLDHWLFTAPPTTAVCQMLIPTWRTRCEPPGQLIEYFYYTRLTFQSGVECNSELLGPYYGVQTGCCECLNCDPCDPDGGSGGVGSACDACCPGGTPNWIRFYVGDQECCGYGFHVQGSQYFCEWNSSIYPCPGFLLQNFGFINTQDPEREDYCLMWAQVQGSIGCDLDSHFNQISQTAFYRSTAPWNCEDCITLYQISDNVPGCEGFPDTLVVCPGDGTDCGLASEEDPPVPPGESCGSSTWIWRGDTEDWFLRDNNCEGGDPSPPGNSGTFDGEIREVECDCTADNPWWCTPAGCVQAATQPTEGVGPYNTQLDCENECIVLDPCEGSTQDWICASGFWVLVLGGNECSTSCDVPCEPTDPCPGTAGIVTTACKTDIGDCP